MQSLRGVVPKNWKERKIKEVATTHSGGTPLRSNDRYYNGRIPWVKSSELKQKYLFDTEEYITELALKSTSARMVKADSILFAMYGATAGDMAILKRDSSLNQAVLAISINKDEDIDLEYLYYSLKRLAHKLIFMSQGGGQPNLSKGIIDNLFFSYPSKSEQTAIASVLSKVDETIQATQNTIKAAERLKKALMQNLLTGKLKPDGTWRIDDEFYMDEKFGKVPIGWKVKPLKSLAKVQRGKFGHRPRNEPRFYGGIHPFVQTSDIVNSTFYLKQHLQTLSELGVRVSRKFPKKTIIMTIAANIGDVAITEYEVFFPDSLIGINCFKDIITNEFLLISLMTKKTFLNQVATESAQKNINYGNLRPLPIFHPTDLNEQMQIASKIKTVFHLIEERQKKIKTLQRLKKSLMQNLLTGKVRVDVAKVNEILLQTQAQEA